MNQQKCRRVHIHVGTLAPQNHPTAAVLYDLVCLDTQRSPRLADTQSRSICAHNEKFAIRGLPNSVTLERSNTLLDKA